MSAPPARIDTTHIRSPRDPMTAEEQEAVRVELRASSEALLQHVSVHGDPRAEWAALFDHAEDDATEHDAA